MEAKEARREFKFRDWYALIVSVTIVIGIAVVAIAFRETLSDVKEYGYLGAFIIGLMSAATIIVYIPGIPVVFFLGSALPYPIFVGLAAGLGEAIGELTAYYVGRSGHAFIRERFHRVYTRVERWIRIRGYLTVFLSSAVFNPIFDIIGAAAGAMRYPVWKFFFWCWAGKTVKTTVVAYLGYYCLGSILRWLNIGI